MKNFLFLFVIICFLGGVAYWGIKYKFKMPDISALNPFGKSEFEKKVEEFTNRIKDLESKSDSLQPIIARYQKTTDSLLVVDSLIEMEITDLRLKDRQLEKKLSQSKDSLDKYRNTLKDSMKRYEEMKKNKNLSSNKETIDFFKKY
jgi:hypothetical protein